MSTKKYTQEEVKEIINRATQLQNDDLETDLGAKQGITLEELEEIGAEVGLKNKYLRAAALKYQERDIIKSSGSNGTHNFEVRDLAINLDSNAWDELTSELRHYFGTQYGETKEDPKRLEWTYLSMSGIETKVNLTNRGDTTRLRLSQRVGLGSPVTESIMYGGGLAALLATFGYKLLELSTFTAGLSFVGLFIVCSFGVFALDTVWRDRKKNDLGRLADKLVDQLYGSQLTDRRKKVRFETDVAEGHSEIEIENVLERKSGDENKYTPKNKDRSQI